jgi:hypothetical protein
MHSRLKLLCVLAALAGGREADAACIPGFDFAVFAKNSVDFQGDAGTDSFDSSFASDTFDSSLGSYALTHTCSLDADIGTNSTAPGAVNVQSKSTEICGDVSIGSGGNTGTTVTGNGAIDGTKSVQGTNLDLPDVTVPVLPNATTFDRAFSNEAASLTADKTRGTVSCQNGSLTLAPGTYVVSSLSLTSGCQLIISGKTEIYFTGTLDLQGGTVVNSTGVPSNLMFYGSATASTVTLQGGASASFAIYAPSSSCTLQGNADIYGAVVCSAVHVQGNAHIHYDRALRNVAGGGFKCPPIEVSRAAPVVIALAGSTHVVQGTFEVPTDTPTQIISTASVATFKFPAILGHMRARSLSSLTTFGSNGTASDTSAAKFSGGTILFDAAATGKIPAANNSGCTVKGTCRYIFTNTNAANGKTYNPTTVTFDDAHASAIGALIAPTSAISGIGATEWQTIVRTVLAGKLGGVDRSTVAVIPASAFAGSGTRPTMAYFGATDGMLHAVCASSGGSTATASNICPSLGTELWAFLPGTQLPLVRSNSARVDGSVHVVDAFGDFFNDPATGTKSFRTILTFQTGFAVGATPAVYALDVTDPYTPRLIWEYARPTSPAAVDLGTGLLVATGVTRVSGVPTNLAVVATSNGGSGGAGIYVAGLGLQTGALKWDFKYAYPSPPRGVAADLPLPASGIPAGVVAVDLTGSSQMSHVVFGDLYGDLWKLDAGTGTSATGATTPLFSFTTNKKPIGAVPAIFAKTAGGVQYAAVTSGGYDDPLATSWSSGTQMVVAVKLAATTPMNETATACQTCDLLVKQSLGSGERGFGRALVVGTQLFVTTETADANLTTFGASGATTGHVLAIDLTGNTSTSTSTVRGGIGSVALSGTTLISSDSDQQGKLTITAATTGAKVDFGVVPKLARLLWVSTQ